MRIITGSAKGRRIEAPEGEGTRPTSDKVKGALFNILQTKIKDAFVLDMFSGTGNLGLEALSRGAGKCIFIEKEQKAFQILKKNITLLGFEESCEVYHQDAFIAIEKIKKRGLKLDIVFLDPPYGRQMVNKAIEGISRLDILDYNGIIISEQDETDNLPDKIGNIEAYRTEKYGRTKITFWRMEREN